MTINKKLAKIISLSTFAALSGTGVSAVVACGSNKPSGGSTAPTVNLERLQKELDEMKIYVGQRSKFPSTPIGYKWQISYADDPDKFFNRSKTDYEHGKEVNVTLVTGVDNLEVGVNATKSVVQIVDTEQVDLSNVHLYLDGFNNVPFAPDGSHWIYEVNDRSDDNNPSEVLAGSIGLVYLAANDETYELSSPKTSTRLTASQVIDVDDWNMDNIQVLLDGNPGDSEVTDLPGEGGNNKAVEWKYEVIKGNHKGTTGTVDSFGTDLENYPEMVSINDVVEITASPKGSYSFSDDSSEKKIALVVKNRIDTSDLNFDSAPQAFTTASTEGAIFNGIPEAPDNTYWEITYFENGNKTTSLVEDVKNLPLNTEATISLMPGIFESANNVRFGLSKQLSATSKAKYRADTSLITTASFNNVEATTTGIKGLPPITPGLKWQYKLSEGEDWKDPDTSIDTQTFARGDNVIIHLGLLNDDYEYSKPINDYVYTAAETVNVEPIIRELENQDGDELPKVQMLDNGTVNNLPILPSEGLVWLFQDQNGNSYQKSDLPQLNKGDTWVVKLDTKNNSYRLSQDVSVPYNVEVLGALDVQPNDNTALDNFTASDKGIIDLPDLETLHTHYRYKVGAADWTDVRPTSNELKAAVGSDLDIQIVADDGFGFNIPPTHQRQQVKIKGVINLDFDEIKEKFTVFSNPKDGRQTNLGLPLNVSPTFSKSQNGTYSSNLPENTVEGSDLWVKLVADTDYEIPDDALDPFETTVKKRIDIDGIIDELGKTPLVHSSTGNSLSEVTEPGSDSAYEVTVTYIINDNSETKTLAEFQNLDTETGTYSNLGQITVNIIDANPDDDAVFAADEQLTWRFNWDNN